VSESIQLRFFAPHAERLVVERHLPHWAQAGVVCFITWRTWDSFPRPVLDGWVAERDAWLSRHGIVPDRYNRHVDLGRLSDEQRREFHRRITARWEDHLDECHGECALRRPELAQVVADSLKHFDGDRYVLTDFVVMPNHVHVLAAFPDADALLAQCDSWKHFTAVKSNRALGRRGRFWQADGFDHLVRSPERFSAPRRYIADNPRRAGLKVGEYFHYSREGLEPNR